jgi:crotonobetainyl-CoA:carnitine CoA-transferase CaiB-like acyl-CoA transferase
MHTGLNAALAIMSALVDREKSGRGVRIDTSLFECGAAMLGYFATYCLSGHEEPDQTGPSASITVPNQLFRASDGWIAVAASNEPMWSRLCDALGLPELANDPRFSLNVLRTQHRAELVELLEARFKLESRAHWASRLEAAKVSCTPVSATHETIDHPQARAMDLIHPLPATGIEDFRVVRHPVRFGGETIGLRNGPPALGEHTDQIRRTGWNLQG